MALIDSSLSRAELPVFPGATFQEQLVNGRNAALAVLQKYKPNLSFDVNAARQNLRTITSWMERNSADLQTVMGDPSASALPERIRIAFDPKSAQNFVVASFTVAAVGLGPWISGAVIANTTPEFAKADAEARLRVFASILQMEKSGYLDSLFHAEESVLAGLGVPPAVLAAIVIGTVLLAAVVAACVYYVKQLEANNRVMRDLCEKAQASGDTATVRGCIEATKGLQDSDLFGAKSIANAVVLGAVALGGIWLLVTYGPGLMEQWDRRSRR